jgi:hypothetical protein
MAREPFAEKLTSKWIGAAFFWLLKGFSGKYSDLLITQYDRRNMWTGYILNIIFFISIIYFFYKI